MPDYVLDSYALLAYFNSEEGDDVVKELLNTALNGEVTLYLSLINLGEIYYLIRRRRGMEKAQETLETLRSLPVTLCNVSEARVLAAADFKAEYPISYADAFAAALAQELGATLVTGDPEFKKLEPVFTISWLP
ncbi:MAG: type II toxin-antitoxin system VapC family toxin [Anaerolineales bacterium]|nr:type II toxin-antitoxin system VapC family toxin [Anaerolineales bacterium]